MIQYIENTNIAYCDGYKFRKDKKSGYWLCSKLQKRLHIYVYEKYNGKVPKGMEVHHIDMNKDNNEIDNLKLLSKSEHNKLHYSLLSDEEKERRKKIILEKSLPKMLEHNKLNPKSKEWYQKHYEETKDKLHIEREYICKCCGNTFKSTQANSLYCSNACKSKMRRKEHKDNIEKECVICGKTFSTNKYRQGQTCSKQCAYKLRFKNI